MTAEKQISQEFDVALEVLKLFLPEVIHETVDTQIDADQGRGPYEISRLLGVSERAVLAYTYSPPTTTEESKHPQLTSPHLPLLLQREHQPAAQG
jgi:hypothetical protein